MKTQKWPLVIVFKPAKISDEAGTYRLGVIGSKASQLRVTLHSMLTSASRRPWCFHTPSAGSRLIRVDLTGQCLQGRVATFAPKAMVWRRSRSVSRGLAATIPHPYTCIPHPICSSFGRPSVRSRGDVCVERRVRLELGDEADAAPDHVDLPVTSGADAQIRARARLHVRVPSQ